MRVIGGLLQGRNIKYKFKTKPRPTLSIVREAFFDILATDIDDVVFIDLFSGSGSMGIEAFSRGASSVFFIENDKPLCESLKTTIDKYKINGNVLLGNYKINIVNLRRMKVVGDIIYIDPPYFSSLILDVLKQVLKNKILSKDGWLVTENYFKDKPISDLFLSKSGLILKFEKTYGISKLSFYRYKNG